MTKSPSISINFEKLYNIPYIAKFDKELFEQDVNTALLEWEQYEQYYDQVALIRAVECTNGCVQYAYRDQEPYALSLEQTRACMKLSMGFILSKEITLPGSELSPSEHVVISPNVAPMVDKMRELYLNGFKYHDRTALRQFYAHSVAMLNLIGRERIDRAIFTLQEHFKDVFTEFFIQFGQGYMAQFLECIDESERAIDDPDADRELRDTLINTLQLQTQTTESTVSLND